MYTTADITHAVPSCIATAPSVNLTEPLSRFIVAIVATQGMYKSTNIIIANAFTDVKPTSPSAPDSAVIPSADEMLPIPYSTDRLDTTTSFAAIP